MIGSSGISAGDSTGGYDSAGDYNTTITASDGTYSGSYAIAWNIAPAISLQLLDANSEPISDPQSLEGDTIAYTAQATETGVSSFTYSKSNLPTGLSLNTSTGAITGTISAGSAATFNTTITATHGSYSVTEPFTWTVSPRISLSLVDPSFNPVTAPTNDVGNSVNLIAEGTSPNLATLTYSASNLPSGLSINSSTGAITGTISSGDTTGGTDGVDGIYNTTITASDGTYSGTMTIPWNISHFPVQLEDSGSNPVTAAQNAVGETISPLYIQASTSGTLSYHAHGLPSGLSVNSSTGQISGTISSGDATGGVDGTGVYDATVYVSDGTHTASQAVTWNVESSALLQSVSDQVSQVGDSISLQVPTSTSSYSGLTFTASNLPDGLSIDPQSGLISGSPDEPFNGTVTVSMGFGTDSETFHWNVGAAPTTSVPAEQGTGTSTAITLSTANGNAIAVSSPYGNNAGMTENLSITGGTLALASTTGLTFLGGSTNNSASMSFSGSVADINAALDGLTYTPSSGTSGEVILNATTTDNLHTVDLTNPLQDAEQVGIVVGQVTVQDPGTQSTNSHQPLSFSPSSGNGITVIDPNVPSAGMELDLSVSDGTLSFPGTNGLTFKSGTNGASSMDITGDPDDINAAIDGLVYTPSSTFSGTDTLYLTAYQSAVSTGTYSTDSFNIDVGGPNITAPASLWTNTSTTLTLSSSNSNAIQVSDPSGGSTSLTLTIAVADGTLTLSSTTGLTFASGSSNGTASLTFSGTVSAINSALNAGLAYAPTTGFTGGTAISVTAAETGTTMPETDFATIPVTVGGHVVAVDDTATVDENTPTTIDVLSLDSAVSGTLTITTLGTPSHGTAAIFVDNGTTIVYTPDTAYVGSDSFTDTISNGTYTSTATVYITVNKTNDATTSIPDQYNYEGDTVDFIPPTPNAAEPLTFSVSGLPLGLSLANSSTGEITGTPDYGDAETNGGVYTVKMTSANASNSDTFTSTFHWYIDNTDPLAPIDSLVTKTDSSGNVTILAGGSVSADDTTGETLSFSISGPSGASITATQNGSNPDLWTAAIGGTISDTSQTYNATVSVTNGTVTDIRKFLWTNYATPAIPVIVPAVGNTLTTADDFTTVGAAVAVGYQITNATGVSGTIAFSLTSGEQAVIVGSSTVSFSGNGLVDVNVIPTAAATSVIVDAIQSIGSSLVALVANSFVAVDAKAVAPKREGFSKDNNAINGGTTVPYKFNVEWTTEGPQQKVGIEASITTQNPTTTGDLAKLYGGTMINWYQMVVSDANGQPINNYAVKNPENAYNNIIISKGPYIDDPAGGYPSPAFPIADGLPWYENVPGAPLFKLPFDARLKKPRQPGPPTGTMDPTKNVGSMSDKPGGSPLGEADPNRIVFKTWPVIIDKEGNPKKVLQGFTWTWTLDEKGQATITNVKLLDGPPTKAEFEDLLAANGFGPMVLPR